MSVQAFGFEPIYKEKIWGGRALERLFARPLPAGKTIGESWDLADLAEGESVVADGPDAGKTLNEVLRVDPGAILGGGHRLKTCAAADGRFPLLVKLLDANETLSLQVHPDEAAARRIGPPAAMKTECWYIVESRDGHILKGVRPGVTAKDFRAALAGGDNPERLRELVNRIDVSAGEFYYLPAGTIHALGAGVVVAEVQTPSDTTYRVSDWGRGREIHVAQALECIHYLPPAARPPGAGGDVLVAGPYFTLRLRRASPGKQPIGGGRCAVWMALAGRGRLAGADGRWSVDFPAGRTVLLPAAMTAATLEIERELTWLETTLPEGR